MIREIIFVLLVIVLVGCVADSKTVDENSKNWERAYGSYPPEYVKIKNSWFWKSSHWSHEVQFFFSIDSCKQVEDDILAGPNSEKLILRTDTMSVVNRIIKITDNERPEWFAPKPLDSYKIWSSDDPFDNFILLKDTLTSELYWFDMQL